MKKSFTLFAVSMKNLKNLTHDIFLIKQWFFLLFAVSVESVDYIFLS